MKTLLITAIAGDIAQGLATIIRENFPDWRLLGMDIHNRHGGELFVDRLFQAPRANDPRYDGWLAELFHRESVDICIPMSEAELLHFNRTDSSYFSAVKLIMPNSKAIEVGSDKLETSNFLKLIGCENPWTLPAENFDRTTSLPCIIKPRRSAGSKSVYICSTAADVEYYRHQNPHSILQELLLPASSEITCAVFRDGKGRIAVLQLLRELVGGFTGWAEVVEYPDVKRQCVQVAEALDLKGSINIQLRVTDNGPRIFEINPRFSSTVLMRHRMGFKDAIWSLNDILGKKIEFFVPEVGTTMVRVQGAAFLQAKERDTNVYKNK